MCSGKGKISGIFFFDNMNLGMFDRFCPSLKSRVQLEERVDMNKFDRNREIYVHRHVTVVHGIIINLWSYVVIKKLDMKKRGKILNIFSLIKLI